MATSSRHSLRLALTTGEVAARSAGNLLLEQESWDPYTGHLTKVAALAWLDKILFGGDAPVANCPGDGPGYRKAIYAYPVPKSLTYRLYLSNGIISGPMVEEKVYTELLQCNLSLTPPLKYPAQAIISHEWVAETYNDQGEMVAPPQVTIKNNAIRLSAKVWGTMRVSYLVCRHTYVVEILPRAEYGEKKLQAFAVAVWAGGNKYLEIEAPATAEDGNCNNRWNPGSGAFDYLKTLPPGGSEIGGTDFDDDEPFRPVPPEDETVYIDYCSQKEDT